MYSVSLHRPPIDTAPCSKYTTVSNVLSSAAISAHEPRYSVSWTDFFGRWGEYLLRIHLEIAIPWTEM